MSSLPFVTGTQRRDDDLDTLIGEAEAEAARRRAGPGYPHDLEIRIDAELARYSPVVRGRELEHLVAGVEQASFVNADAPTTARWKPLGYLKLALKRLLSWYLRHITDQVSVLGLLTARALATLTKRLEVLENRVANLERVDADQTGQLPTEPVGAPPSFQAWATEVHTLMSGVPGRILYADLDARATVARLRDAGLDAYGLSANGTDSQASPDIRHGQLFTHLEAVDDGALAGIVVAGLPDAMDRRRLAVLIAHLARAVVAGGRVVVIGEAPWWWRERLGPVESDLVDRSPLSPETWIAFLTGAGFSATAHYSADGHSYGVVADRTGESEGHMT